VPTDYTAELLAWFNPSEWQNPAIRGFIEAVRNSLTATLDELFALREFAGKVVTNMEEVMALARNLKDKSQKLRDAIWTARPLAEWREEYGSCLWWRFPVVEPPYVGTPLDRPQFDKWDNQCGGWPGNCTHWTPIFVPSGGADEPVEG
jgi:hypothetical protein